MSEIPYIQTAVDVRLGDKLESFDVDYDALVQRMRDEGFTDEQIAETTLVFYADCYGTQNDESVETLLGEYNRQTKDVTVYPGHLLTAAQVDSSQKFLKEYVSALHTHRHHLVATGAAQAAQQEALNGYSDVLSRRATSTLYHELRHKRNDVVEPIRGMNRFKAKVLARPVGAYALTLGSLDYASLQIVDSLHVNPLYQLVAIPFMVYGAAKAAKAASYTDREIYLMNPDEVSARDASNDVASNIVSMRIKPLLTMVDNDIRVAEAEEPQPTQMELPVSMTKVHGPFASQ